MATRARLLSCWGIRPLGLRRMYLPGCGGSIACTCQAVGAPSHVPARLWGRRRVELPGRGRVWAPWPPGCCDRQGSMAALARLLADEVGGLGVRVDEAT
jgi:hypothetical protein